MAFIESESELQSLEDNHLCADCNTNNPTHCDVEYGVLLCGQCGLAHKDMKGNINHEIKILEDDQLTQKDIRSVLDRGGNKQINDEFEKFLPSSYTKSLAQINMFIRRQYIKRKYASRGFAFEDYANTLNDSRRIGILSKRSEVSDNEWNLQYIVLDRDRQVIECLLKGGAFEPEEVIPLASAEVFIEKLEANEGAVEEHCIRISWEKEKYGKSLRGADSQKIISANLSSSTRWKERVIKHIFLTSGQEEEIFEWYCCILIAQGAIPRSKQRIHIPKPNQQKLTMSKSAPTIEIKLPSRINTEIISAAPIFFKTGRLWKSGPDKLNGWKERWFTLYDNHLVYSRSKLFPFASGEFHVGTSIDGYKVEKGHMKYTRSPPNDFTFTVTTPWRNYCLCAETAQERDEWVEQVNKMLHRNNSTMLLRSREFNVEKDNGSRKACCSNLINVFS
ncbi:Arf-GAP with dual PH domain-containing 2-like protein [Oopsacas minuta]|uniref:Arf-GAP with dual PH domain-containing 2-like protein n=1 Tax=Oopsacas minuta TaxID=111878 RepID=A0AAV7JDD5_9METZ|nr:Arf-GAP with dual PH domain-containing 2-like protein [Oopsacas minuta]